MKIIIVGCGKVGQALAERLSIEKHDVTVIDTDSNKLREITDSLDVLCMEGNGIRSDVLIEAGIKNTDVLIAVTESDEKNTLCCLIAKNAGNCQTIARIRNPEYVYEMDNIKEELNLALVLNPDNVAALEIARLINYPSSVIKCDRFADGRVDMITVDIPKDSVLEGMRLKNLSSFLHCNILVCAVERNGDFYIPGGEFVLHSGDCISFVGASKDQQIFFKALKMDTEFCNSVMIIGASKVARYLATHLEKTQRSVKVIEFDPKKCAELSAALEKTTVICGDATDENLLIEEGIKEVDAVVTLTGLDEENIMISLYASSVSDCKVITKINRLNFQGVIDRLDLGSIVNPKISTADRIVRHVRGLQNSRGSMIKTLYKIAQGKAEALEFVVQNNFNGINKPIMDLSLRSNLVISCICRDSKVIIPGGQDVMRNGDKVIIVTSEEGLEDLNDILSK